LGGVAQPLHTTQTHIPRHKHMRAQTQPSSPPQTPHTHLDPRPDPRSTLCHADPATRTLPHTHTLTLFLSLSFSLAHTHTHTLAAHWQHTHRHTDMHSQTLPCLTVSRFWSTAVPAFTRAEKVTACQHNTRSSHTCQKQHQDMQECRRSREMPGTLM
jgi:hypothetical protein